ncbi:MAG: nucleotidyltransferase domain-containing protein [Proteobacteria bacterium]|jgi:predicted nucleotidyltransferase|nr:nucleotidyltransferase domain-containing protein [Pseudomonadota bacterium]
MTKSVQIVLSLLRGRLEALYGDRLVGIVLFGSQARGEASPGSDIDVMVVVRGPVDPGEEIERVGPITAALSLEHDVVLSCVFVSSDRYSNERSPLLLNVRREGVAV